MFEGRPVVHAHGTGETRTDGSAVDRPKTYADAPGLPSVSLLAFRPTREHVLPALVALFPGEWFVLRSIGTAAIRDGPVPLRELAVGSLGAFVVAYLVAVAAVSVTRAWEVGRSHGHLVAALHPSDRTLAVLGVFLLGAAGYFLASLFVTFTGLLGAAFAVVGLLFGLPFVLAFTASVAVTNAFGVQGLGTAAAVVGLAASAVWTFGLAVVAGRFLARRGWGRELRRDRED